MAEKKTPVAVAKGDGIGPEIMGAVLNILEEAGAALEIHDVKIGEEVYKKGFKTGVEPKTWDVLRETEAFLKAPITTPQGGGFKSLNVTIRGAFSLFANVRPCVSYDPIIKSKHPGMDVVIVRENEEDLYTGIEYRNTQDAVHALKIITRSGCERIIRFAFEYAKIQGRKKVTCFTKDNILKLTDGLFHKVYEEIAQEYPDIENEHWIIDIGSAKLADAPTNFDVVVTPNLYGDILSDIAAQIAGSVGLAGSANIGKELSMFEAIHGSAPRRAGQNLANPSGMLLAAIMMLKHIGQEEAGVRIHNAWLKTLEEGVHTYDIHNDETSRKKVGTKEFGEAVIKRLGQKPETLPAVREKGKNETVKVSNVSISPQKKTLEGVDIYLDWTGKTPDLQKQLSPLADPDFELTLITNRGTKVWPDTMEETFLVDHWRARFKSEEATSEKILELQKRLLDAGFDCVQVEKLYAFDGESAYSTFS